MNLETTIEKILAGELEKIQKLSAGLSRLDSQTLSNLESISKIIISMKLGGPGGDSGAGRVIPLGDLIELAKGLRANATESAASD